MKDRIKYQLKGHYYHGAFHLNHQVKGKIAESGDELIEKYCPANLNDKLWEISINYSHIDLVVESAQQGFHKWRKLSFAERANFLKAYQEKVMKRKDDIAQAIAYETGKPLWEAQTEAAAVISKVQTTLEDSLPRIKEQSVQNILPETTGHVMFKPLGPSLIIGPFNFPCHLANGQLLSSLMAGNSVIFKPSEKTFYSSQIMMECLDEAGFPAGVVNLILGGAEVARRLLQEPSIKGIYFTGSKEVGQKILEVTHKDLSKLVALELGGKNTTIIHQDARLDHAMAEMINSCFLTAGQRCTSTSIIAIHESIKDEFIHQFHQVAKKIIIDHPVEFDHEPFMGPLIDDKAVQNYLVFMGMAIREGAEEIMRGKALTKKFKGHYVSPSIHLMNQANPKSLFFMSEIFAPTCTFVPYREIEEAIHITNMGEYGLAASIFTENKQVYSHCLQNLDVGMLNYNRGTIGASSKLPFGGVKSSGNYRPAAVSMIDACVYPLASLEVLSQKSTSLSSIKGLQP